MCEEKKEAKTTAHMTEKEPGKSFNVCVHISDCESICSILASAKRKVYDFFSLLSIFFFISILHELGSCALWYTDRKKVIELCASVFKRVNDKFNQIYAHECFFSFACQTRRREGKKL